MHLADQLPKVCLSYPEMEWSVGQPMSLIGTKNDLRLILRHLGCKFCSYSSQPPHLLTSPLRVDRHRDNSREFSILTDFDESIIDACGVSNRVKRTFGSKEAIVSQ